MNRGLLMTNENVHEYLHDRLLKRTLLRVFPRWIRPNHLTVLRGCMVPFVLYFLWLEKWEVAVPLFLVAGLTDLLDGSLARTRKQITLWGTVADPIADKFLIATVVVMFVAREINPMFAIVMVCIEALIGLSGLVRRRRGEIISANWYGKIKMFLQVVGIAALLVAKWSGVDMFVPFSIGTLSLAIAFAIVSLYTYGF